MRHTYTSEAETQVPLPRNVRERVSLSLLTDSHFEYRSCVGNRFLFWPANPCRIQLIAVIQLDYMAVVERLYTGSSSLTIRPSQSAL